MNQKELALGMEFGSTRIKAVLIDRTHQVVAGGDFVWQSAFENGIWTYDLADAVHGLQVCFARLKADFQARYGCVLTTVGVMGISGMMHGYLPFDREGQLLTPFRTWQNIMTKEAAAELSERFGFNIPERWSVAHLYQAILNGEEHVPAVAQITTLSGYIHERLTGRRVLGIGDAAGMFPVDSRTKDYDAAMTATFDRLVADRGFPWRIREILPTVLTAGEDAGTLTEAGARLLDPTGDFGAGVPFAPPEGDGDTGMAATNTVRAGRGNVSAGTSIFAVVVTDKRIPPHREIDVAATPDGSPVAMIHGNNCTGEINAWVHLFAEFAAAIGYKGDLSDLFSLLFRQAMDGEPDAGGLVGYNYLSGEIITGVESGRPLFLRETDSRFTLPNFMRMQLMSAVATLRLGMEILGREGVRARMLSAHGGYFKTPFAGQSVLAAALNCPIAVTETAGEGGPYGMALLAAYRLWRREGESLADYLDERVFAGAKQTVYTATEAETAGFDRFMERYRQALPLEQMAGRQPD